MKYLRNPKFWVPVFIFLFAIVAHLVPGARTIDDSYITFRYARNILAGNGFVYNPGEQVLGTTTPLYTLTMVVISLPFGGENANFPQLAYIINAFFDAITCLLLINIGRRLGSWHAGVGTALVWAVAPYSVTFAIGGLETSLFVLLIIGITASYLHTNYGLTALLAALAVLTRPDALILICPLIVDRLWIYFSQRKKPPYPYSRSEVTGQICSRESIIIETLTFILPIGAWLLFSMAYFGNPLPHSIAAKSVAYRLPDNAAFIRLLQHYATPFMGHLTFGIPWIGVGLLLYIFLYIIGAKKNLREKPHTWPFIAYPWLYFVVFAIANPLIFRWYLTPPLPLFILTILIGLDTLIKDIYRKYLSRIAAPDKQFPRFASLITIIFVIMVPTLLSLRNWRIYPEHGLDRPAPEMAWYQLELLYKQAAEILLTEDAFVPEQSILAAGDVGVLGYFTRSMILDTVGLNTPSSTQYYPADPNIYVINYAIPSDLIMDKRPDYIVILEVYGRKGLFKDSRFQSDYTLLYKIPTDIYGSDGMLIFANRALSQAQ